MIRSLQDFRMGSLNRERFIKKIISRRACTISLSPLQDFENVHSAGINFIDLDNTEGRYILSGAADGTIYIHDVFNFTGSPQYSSKLVCKIDKQNRSCHAYSVECVQWYPVDTGMFLSSGMDHTLRVWDTNKLKPADVFNLGGKIYHHHMSKIASKHALVAVATSSPQVVLVDLRSGSRTHELRGHQQSVLSIKWSPRSEYLVASGSMDNRLLLWDVRASKSCLLSMDQNNGKSPSKNELRTAHNGYVHGISFTSDGLFLLSLGTDNRMKLWNTENGRNEMVNYGKVSMSSKKGVSFDVSLNTDPQLVFVPSKGNILIYDMQTGLKRNTLIGHFNTVTCCVYNHRNQSVYSGAYDRNILVWSPDVMVKDTEDESLQNRDSEPSTKRFKLTEDAWSSDED